MLIVVSGVLCCVQDVIELIAYSMHSPRKQPYKSF